MSPGKAASQAGHAYLGTFLQASKSDPALTAEYTAEHPHSPGTKVCLEGNLDQITRALEEASQLKIPHFLVVDSGCANFFGGKPIITALGLGPARKDTINKITRRFKLVP